MAAAYSVHTVFRDLLVGAYTVLLLGTYALGIFLVVFLIFADGSPEASRSECAAEAGW
jgi:hypothetical protein